MSSLTKSGVVFFSALCIAQDDCDKMATNGRLLAGIEKLGNTDYVYWKFGMESLQGQDL